MQHEINYEKDVKIDESALDVEWLAQPSLMLKYAQYAIEMSKIAEKGKGKLDVKKAELDKRIRTNPEEFGITKITESVVMNEIITHPEYQKINDEYIELKYEADMAKVAVQAFVQRKDTLQDLVKLHGQQYFAGPTAPRDLSKEWENRQIQKKVNTGIAGKLKGKKK